MKQYDEADIKRVGYTRAGTHGNRYMSTTAIFRNSSTYEDIFFLCSQIRDWGRGWSDHCMTTALMEAIARRGGKLFHGRSGKARLNDVAKVAAAACDFIQLRIAEILRGSTPSGLQLVVDLALMADIEELNIVTLNHDTLVEQVLTANGIQFVDGFGARDGDVRWYADDAYDASAAKVKLFKLHGSIDWYQFAPVDLGNSRTAVFLGSNPRLASDRHGNHLEVIGPGPSFLSGQDKPIAYLRGDDARLNRLVLLHRTPQDLTWRSLIVVTSFDGWIRQHRLIQIRQWLCDLRGDALREHLAR